VGRTLGAWVHGLLGWINYLFWTVVVGFGIGLARLNPTDPLRRGGGRALSLVWGRWMWWSTPFWWRRWRGLHKLPEEPCILVSNHQSTIDIPCLFGLPMPVKISARPGIFRVPVMGPFLKWSGQVNTDHFLEEATAALEGGMSVVVFSEGSRSADGQIQKFRSGAFKLAVATGRPIVPIVMDGAQYIMSKRAYFPTRPYAVVDIEVLDPVPAGNDARALSRDVRGRMIAALDAMRGRRAIELNEGPQEE
jgi:1-acyl-sn-glycerol-3-phosphate acyltransferase